MELEKMEFLGEGGADGPENGNTDTGAGGEGGGEGGNGDGGAGGSGAGDGGAGGGGDDPYVFDDACDKPVVQSLRKALGDQYNPDNVNAILKMVQEVPGLKTQLQQFESYKPYQPQAQFLAENPGLSEVVKYLQAGGKNVGLFQELASMNLGEMRPEQAIAFQLKFEHGYSDQEVNVYLKQKYGIGEQVDDPLDEGYIMKQAQLKSDGGAAMNWVKEFQEKAPKSADKRESGPSLEEIGRQWDPVIENAKKTKLDIAHQIVTPTGEKVDVPFQFLSNDEIEARTVRIARGLALDLGLPLTEQNQNLILTLARNAAIGMAVPNIVKSAMTAAAKSGMDYMSKQYAGNPGLGGGNLNGGGITDGELKFVSETGQNQDKNKDYW